MKPSNTIIVSPKYIEEKERQIADLSKKVERLQEQLESDEMALTEGQEIIAELKAQLNEANEIIKKFYWKDMGESSNYIKKWGVK